MFAEGFQITLPILVSLRWTVYHDCTIDMLTMTSLRSGGSYLLCMDLLRISAILILVCRGDRALVRRGSCIHVHRMRIVCCRNSGGICVRISHRI